MFTFHWLELLAIVLVGLVLLFGLSLLMLRRRNEMLQQFLTPEQRDIEEEFFRIRHPQQDQEEIASEENETAAGTEGQATETEPEDTVHWGTPPETPEAEAQS